MIPRKPSHKGFKTRSKRLNPRGKSNRSLDRQAWQRELSAYWQERGMPNYCEVRSAKCINIFLTPAHSKDRGDIYTKQDFFEIVWACEKCHFWADREIAKDDRLLLFKEIIENR